MLSRDAILGAKDTTIQTVAVPEWGGDVLIRVIDGVARDTLDAFLAKAIDKSGKLTNPVGMRVLVCRLALCDADGKPIFGPDEDAALATKASTVLDRIFRAAARLNGIGDAAIEDARETF